MFSDWEGLMGCIDLYWLVIQGRGFGIKRLVIAHASSITTGCEYFFFWYVINDYASSFLDFLSSNGLGTFISIHNGPDLKWPQAVNCAFSETTGFIRTWEQRTVRVYSHQALKRVLPLRKG